ncbi:uncharacterized protein LOC126458331 [Schistocerca serialis cubense]|uniref:uncharacterized protein LOC126458331 n=1 Tax=Schistocerca serialis cubense TaxID=2023355 RepID=UPI00214E368D|nr:uncharacterized protein LOC126458331 [Schistocerca serialis cubense]
MNEIILNWWPKLTSRRFRNCSVRAIYIHTYCLSTDSARKQVAGRFDIVAGRNQDNISSIEGLHYSGRFRHRGHAPHRGFAASRIKGPLQRMLTNFDVASCVRDQMGARQRRR